MTRTSVVWSSRCAVATAAIALVLSHTSTPRADERPMKLRTRPVAQVPTVRDATAYWSCRIVGTSATPISIVARIVTRDGTDVTGWGTGFRASPAATGDGTYYAEETAGSIDRRSWSCTARVTGATRDAIRMSLSAVDATGVAIVIVDAP